MSYGEKQVKLISDAVKEQLGIEEDEDDQVVFLNDYLSIDEMNAEIKRLNKSLKDKDVTIQNLEFKLTKEVKRIDTLEKLFYEFKNK